MVTRVRTIDFLPEIFKSKTNERFLTATLDQLIQQPDFTKVQGYIGSKFGYGVKDGDAYITEPSAQRSNYQLEPSVIFKKKDTETAIDLITYPGILDAIGIEGSVIKDDSLLFKNEFYSWDSFTDLDKIINYARYYWLPNGPDPVTITTDTLLNNVQYGVNSDVNTYRFAANTVESDTDNPTLYLLRGGTYEFKVDQSSKFWIQTLPGTTGVSPTNSSISTREVYGVDFNGSSVGTMVFTVPQSTAQDIYKFPGNVVVDLVTSKSINDIDNQSYYTVLDIDGVTDIDGKTLMFYNSTSTGLNTNFYTIALTGNPSNPIVKLTQSTVIPNNQNITVTSGNTYSGRNFVRNTQGTISLLPIITSDLDTLYYQDGTNPLKVGEIKLVNASDIAINVNDILGKTGYTSPNGVTLTNGLKILFTGNVTPASYKNKQYYVEGVGTGITLISTDDFIVPEPFGQSLTNPFDVASYDEEAFANSLFLPYDQDYIVISRNSKSRNAWSRSNRWFHEDVLKLSIEKNVTSPLSSAAYGNSAARAKRPIIEFYPELKLFAAGVIGKAPVDYINFTVTDAFNQVNGHSSFSPDGTDSQLYDGARVVFANDSDLSVRSTIYLVSIVNSNGTPIISLSKAPDGDVQYNEQAVITKGTSYQGTTFYFDGSKWHQGQQKDNINQPPKFDVFDSNGVSFGDQDFYPGSDFSGCTLFQYAIGSGANDPVLKFPIKYSSINNLGDITFDVTLNSQTFNYVNGSVSTVGNVNKGYVYSYNTRTDYTRNIGWQTAIDKSFQYQVFNLVYETSTPTFTCDVSAMSSTDTAWPSTIVYVNNVRLASTEYTVTTTDNSTTILLATTPTVGDAVDILIYSNQVSTTGYFQIPSNLDHNPFNDEIATINLGDIRGHYKSICNNVPNLVGTAFGSNNFRDLGNIVPYGTRIIQSSAPIYPAALFLRNKTANIHNSIEYNSREYVKFKSLLIDTVNKLEFSSLQDSSSILDEAMVEISSVKFESNPFFWSDMLPTKTPAYTKTYTFKSGISTSVFPLSKVYSFTSANYESVLVYLTRKVDNRYRTTQLVKGVDYAVSTTDKSVTVFTDLIPNDVITVKEYSQTYGSFVPNTPTKIGLYPATHPEVILDNTYSLPTYFIKGHDGSYTKLYGSYTNGYLEDFRDIALLEFETRVYNNIKVDAKIPVAKDDIISGQFRTTDFSQADVQEMYNTSFLNWVGLNRVNYTSQQYVSTNEFSWNYSNCVSKIDNKNFLQGNWRGIYLWYYDTATPNLTPWEMLGLASKPTWWDARYGEAPYTSDNTLLWQDLANGYVYNDGNSYIDSKRVRPKLLDIIPVDTLGKLKSPFSTLVASYDSTTFNSPWKSGDVGPTEYSYLKSSTWPFDLMRLVTLTKPAEFFSLGLNLDAYKYNTEFNQYLVNNRTRLTPNDVVIYGTDSTTATHSYLDWVVDYARQFGLDGSTIVYDALQNLDVRLTYKMAGFSDKDMLKFFVERGSASATTGSLLIPDESYSVLLYENQANDIITFSSIIIQKTTTGYKVYGNSQNKSYFVALTPIMNGLYDTITVNALTVKLNKTFSTDSVVVPYGTEFASVDSLSMFIKGYGKYLESQGMQFNDIENSLELSWDQMIAEMLYWAQSGWEVGSTVNVNPCANSITIDKENNIVQPLTIQRENFILNQNLIPIQLKDLAIHRSDTLFSAKTLNQGDTVSFFTAQMSNIEHVVVFNNTTAFNDILFNLTTGLRQQRFFLKGAKTSSWNGTMNAAGFIINQDNVVEWAENTKYTKGAVVKYKNKYWMANEVIEPSTTFNTSKWVLTSYDKIQQGLLPNASSRAFESTLYYDINRANLESDGDLLGFSLIGYRPRQYLVDADLDDITQVNVYKNMLDAKGTNAASTGLNGITVQQNKLAYTVHENWAIKQAEFGGLLNQNLIEFTLDESKLVGNPSVVSIVSTSDVAGAEQQVPLYQLKNYGRSISTTDILPVVDASSVNKLPSAGYVNLDDVRAVGYNVTSLNDAIVTDIYNGDYIWIADHKSTWNVFSSESMKLTLVNVINNLNGTATFVFSGKHSLVKNDPFGIINFAPNIDGYYVVTSVSDLTSVVVDLALDNATTMYSGSGLAILLETQRATKARDVSSLPITFNEYTSNKVWVDNNVAGNWTVYERHTNYSDMTFPHPIATDEFGSAVAYVPNIGHLATDPANNKMYRYEPLGSSFVLTQTFEQVSATRFGTAITSNDRFVVVSDSNPNAFDDETESFFYVYRIVVTPNLRTLVLEQVESVGGSRAGDAMDISGDSMYLYVNLIDFGIVAPYQLDEDYVYEAFEYVNISSETVSMELAHATVPGTDYFIVSGDWTTSNATVTIPEGKYVAFNNDSFETVYTVITGFYNEDTDETTFYTVEKIQYSVASGTQVYKASTHFSLIEVQVDGVTYPDLLTVEGGAAAKFGYSLATNYDGTKLFIGAPNTGYSSSGLTLLDIGSVYLFDRLVCSVDLNYNGSVGGYVVLNLPYVFNRSAIVTINGVRLQTGYYILVLNALIISSTNVRAGDVITVSSGNFTVTEQFTSYESDPSIARDGEKFGFSIDCNTTGSELIVGSPFDIHSTPSEGAVYRFTSGSKRFGVMSGLVTPFLDRAVDILINNFTVAIPPSTASDMADAINAANITNVEAYSTVDGYLVIQLRNINLSPNNDKLNISVFESDVLARLGFTDYVKTQVFADPKTQNGKSQFGYAVKYNNDNSFIVSAPTNTRYVNTVFDFSDDANYHNDTVFDNGFTQWEDTYPSGGSVYMYDYINSYNEGLTAANIGKYLYAQSCNDLDVNFGVDPYYGTAISFNDGVVMVGSPNFSYDGAGGRVVSYVNSTSNKQNWSVYREYTDVVDINKIQKVQMYNNIDDSPIESLDYFDPLQGKLLGAVRENIDYILSYDPAGYNNTEVVKGNSIWAKAQVGKIWFDTSTTKFLNYYQSDVTYDSKHWGKVFPGSSVDVYTWVENDLSPVNYTGTGTPYDLAKFTVTFNADANHTLVPKYYFWVKNTNVVNIDKGKSLSDSVISSYITNPQNSGIPYLAPLKRNTFALYNASEFINGTNTNMHIGFNSGAVDSSSHTEFKLIRSGYPDDFLPGLPDTRFGNTTPSGLYDRLLDSLSGTDESGLVVPDPYVPKMLQTGISARPRQSLFVDRFKALENYLTYANSILKTMPIAESENATFLKTTGDFFDTASYWEYIYWWDTGYSNSTRTSLEVPMYADLATITPVEGLIVGVVANGAGKREVYICKSSAWVRIGLEDGTIQFLDTLWNVQKNKIGFGDNFFDSVAYDKYPSIETRYIVRALNEQLFTGTLAKYRNDSLIATFEYIQSENIGNNNYMPWLTKTSLADVSYTVRELLPYQQYQQENTNLLEGYINEIKPYHVVIKEFSLKYTGTETYNAGFTDFDLPPQYDVDTGRFESPQLVYKNAGYDSRYLPTDAIWSNSEYANWFSDYGVQLIPSLDEPVCILNRYVSRVDLEMLVDNAWGLPVQGLLLVGDELIGYSGVDRVIGKLTGLSRGINNTTPAEHFPGITLYMDIPAVIILDAGRDYTSAPTVKAYIDTSIYPAPRKEAVLTAVIGDNKVISVHVDDPGSGYVVTPEIVIDYSYQINFNSINFVTVNFIENTLTLASSFIDGELVKFESDSYQGILANGFYYVHVNGDLLTFHATRENAINDQHRIKLNSNVTDETITYTVGVSAYAVPNLSGNKTRTITDTIRFDRTSYQSKVMEWKAGEFWSSPYSSLGNDSSSDTSLYYSVPYEIAVTSDMATGVGAVFTVNNILLGQDYYVEITEAGSGYTNGTVITIPGTMLAGTSPANDCVITIATTHGAITGITYTGTAVDAYLAGLQGAVLPVVSAEPDADSNTIVTLNFTPSGLLPGQLKGARLYFYQIEAPVEYDDRGTQFVGSITGTTLNVTSIVAGTHNLGVGTTIYGSGVQPLTIITGLGSGSGGTGTYTVGVSQTIAAGTSMNNTGGAYLKIYKPRFNPTSVTQQYFIQIIDPGYIYSIGDRIIVSGSELNGVPGKNDCVIYISYTSDTGGIYLTNVSGTATSHIITYYVFPVSDTSVKLFADSTMTIPVAYEVGAFDYDYGYTPEPLSAGIGYLYDTTSIVSYEGKIWSCLESNNDDTFDTAKWEIVQSDDRRLNALDRITAYYQPTLDMPGKDLQQLVRGISYPHTVYYGNSFAPEDVLSEDIELRDSDFYSRDINVTAIVATTEYDGNTSYIKYVAVADAVDHSIVLTSIDYGQTWKSFTLSNTVLGVTSITFNGTQYTVTTTNTSVPVLMSYDAVNWVASGQVTTFDYLPWDSAGFESTSVGCPSIALNQGASNGITSVAVGAEIVSSSDGVVWKSVYKSISQLISEFYDVDYITSTYFEGYIAVGRGDVITSGVGTAYPIIESYSKIATSGDGISWDVVDPNFTDTVLHAVAGSSDVIVIAGENGGIWFGTNALSWTQLSTTVTETIRSIAYGNSKFVLVGDNGTIVLLAYSVSSNSMSWGAVTGVTSQDLRSVIFDGTRFVAVGANDTILRSSDGITWTEIASILPTEPAFTVMGNDFLYGYGPEELVAGVVSDNLSLKITTAPGSYWDNDMAVTNVQDFWYGHTGFNMVAKKAKPVNSQVSFDGVARNPAQVAVFILNDTAGFGRRIYEYNAQNANTDLVIDPAVAANNPTHYTIDWINKTITIVGTQLTDNQTLMVEVYEIGNGRQLVRTNSQNTPMREDPNTGNTMIIVDIAYTELVTDPIVYVNGVKLTYLTDYIVAENPVDQYYSTFKILFNELYDQDTDYISFAILGNTVTDINENQYGYSIPESQIFKGYAYSGPSQLFTLDIDLSGENASHDNLIVELNGERLLPYPFSGYDYTVNTTNNTISLGDTQAGVDDLLVVTAYNDTQRQWISTNSKSNLMVTPLTFVYNTTPARVEVDFSVTDPAYKFVDGNHVRIDGVIGADGVNNAAYYVKDITDYSPADPADIVYVYELYNDVDLTQSTNGSDFGVYSGGGFIWLDASTVIIDSPDVDPTMPDIAYTDATRTWVTVVDYGPTNGLRVDPSMLRFNEGNRLSILAPIRYGYLVIATAFVTGDTPNETRFNLNVDRKGNAEVYRTNDDDGTWLTHAVSLSDDVIHVRDASRLIQTIEQSFTVASVDGSTLAYVECDLTTVKGVRVYDVTALETVDEADYDLLLTNGRPAVVFTSSSYVGHDITVSLEIGDIVEVNGERIRFENIDLVNNTLSTLIRGVQGTPIINHDIYDTVYGINDGVKLNKDYYIVNWSTAEYNTNNGDPLQISSTLPALFLNNEGF